MTRRPNRLRHALQIESLESRHAMAVFVVSSVDDSGPGTLRSAIESANQQVGADRIEFNIQSSSQSIQIKSALPWLTDEVEIDGTTQPGYSDHPLVELDGSALTNNESGLVVNANNSLIRGLAINKFSFGIFLNAVDGVQLAGNFVGVKIDGSTEAGNHLNGVYVVDSSNNLIGGSVSSDRNVISGNGEIGIRFSGNSTNNRVQGNYIGTDADGLVAIGNGLNGILVANVAAQTIIGTDGDGNNDGTEGNVISGNGGSGIRLDQTSNNRIAGNLIGVGADGNTGLANRANGIELTSLSVLNTIGTNADGSSDDLESNVIGSNKEAGIRINNSRANRVAGNFVGLLSDGATASPNLGSGLLIDGGSSGNQVGRLSATDSAAANVISANGAYGIWLTNSNQTNIFGNKIGRSGDDQQMLVNFLEGIHLDNSNGNIIGGAGERFNSIGYRFIGVNVVGQSLINEISRNNFAGLTGVATDLGIDGPTANDATDQDIGPNALQNYPEIQLANDQPKAAGRLVSTPFTTFTIELYVTGQSLFDSMFQHTFLASTTVTTDGSGVGYWQAGVPSTLGPGDQLTATAYNGLSGTSEFAPAVAPIASRTLELSSSTVAEAVGTLTGQVFRTTSDPPADVVVNLSSSDTTRVTVPTQVTIQAGQQSATFQVTVIDDEQYHYNNIIISAKTGEAGGSAELVVTDNDNPWYNYAKPLDVSRDGHVTAFDALLVINEINAGNTGPLKNRALILPPLYFDTNNDNNLTSFDALLIINALNSGQGGEGEAGVAFESEGQALGGQSGDVKPFDFCAADVEDYLPWFVDLDAIAPTRRR